MTRHPCPRPYLAYWEAFARHLSFLTTAPTLGKIRETVHNGQNIREEPGRALEENRELKRRLQRDGDPP